MLFSFVHTVVALLLSGACLEAFPMDESASKRTRELPLPVVMWHGINNDNSSLDSFKRDILDVYPGLYVENIQIGKSLAEDKINSVTMTAINQIEYVCRLIKSKPELANGYNAIGMSQGGLLIRGLAQRCPNPPAKSLITLGAPSNGIFGVPDCEQFTESYQLCELVRRILNAAAFNPEMQDLVAPAQYWRDPFHHSAFLEGSKFLPDLNNMREEKNQQYKDIISSLAHYVMVMWDDDTIIIPKESSWFGFYTAGQDKVTEPLEATAQYKEDWLGLRTLNESGRLHFYQLTGGHTIVNHYWFRQTILKQYLV